jgi:HEPN domain-containing protein
MDFMPDRSDDWLQQALKDLEHARAAAELAEKAVKALHLSLVQEAWGHVIRRLLEELPEAITVTAEILDRARVLDGYYIPARYPNGHPEGAPFEHYGELQSREAVGHADAIVAFVRVSMAQRR